MSGKRLGDYEILEPLGEGGMGAVYRARHERLGRVVALKVLKPGSLENPEHARRFQREMTIAAGLSHPNLVKILDGGTVDGMAYIAMELVDGLTVTTMVNKWAPLPWPVAVAIARSVADGLAFLHERSILHRDVKPSNILVSYDGFVKVLDFGLARGHNATVMTQDGAVVGTLQYLSPELLTGEEASPTTDLWAVGVVLYLMVCGRMHVLAEEFQAWVQAIVNDPIPPPAGIIGGLPASVSILCTRLLSRDPKARPQTAAALRDELDRLLEQHRLTADRVLNPQLHHVLDSGTFRLPDPPDQPKTAELDKVPTPGASARVKRPRAPSRPDRTPTAPSARPRRRAWIAGPLIAATLAFGAAYLRPRPAPVAPVSSASPTPAAIDPDKVISAHGRKLLQFKQWLSIPGATAKRTVEDLRRNAPMDIGSAPANWLYWIEFEEWLQKGAPGKPPRYPFAEAGPMDKLVERMALSWLATNSAELTPKLIASVYLSVGNCPDDGRTWLSLGRVFELEGRAADALVCYRHALARLDDIDLESSTELIWAGLASALSQLPGRSLEREWFTYLHSNNGRAWAGLKMVLVKDDPAMLERILKTGLTDPRYRDLASVVLGQIVIEMHGDPVRARRLWMEALESQPGSPSKELVHALFVHLVERGLTDDARVVVKRAGKASWEPLVEYLAGDTERPLDWRARHDESVTRGLYLRLESFRLLEANQLPEAEEVMELYHKETLTPGREKTPLFVELMAHGSARAWVEPEVLARLAADPPDFPLWNDAAGALTAPAGQPLMPKWLARPGGATPQHVSGWREAVRALWLSRQGRHAQALDALDAAMEAFGSDWPPAAEFLEVLARPLLDQMAGAGPDAKTLARATSYPVHPSVERGAGGVYLKHLRAGQMDAARQTAKDQFEVSPRATFWALAWALHARYAGDVEEAARARARLGCAVRWHGCGLWVLQAAGR